MRFRGLALLFCSIVVMLGSLFLPAQALEQQQLGERPLVTAR